MDLLFGRDIQLIKNLQIKMKIDICVGGVSLGSSVAKLCHLLTFYD